jgi:hypothetical protein
MRPEIKIGDLVRFRTDGEIGEYNQVEMKHLIRLSFIVDEVDGKMLGISELTQTYYPSILFDIYNDFSNIQVGDEVEIYFYNNTTDTSAISKQMVTKVGEGIFYCGSDMYPYRKRNGTYLALHHTRTLRIVKKAEPRLKVLLQKRQCGKTMQYGQYGVPSFEVGQWVNHNKYGLGYITFTGTLWCNIQKVDGDKRVHITTLTPIPARDVVLDFKHGIKGTVRYTAPKWHKWIGVFNNIGEMVGQVKASFLEEPMRSVVEQLLARQEKER